MEIEHDKPREAFNTLGFAVCAERYIAASDEHQIESALALARQERWPVFVLGGGSNVVLTRDVPGLVVHPVASGYSDARERRQITASAGMRWNDLVRHTIDTQRPGLENLSLIPGSVGAAPVQNIGAYGVELADRFVRCRAFHLPSAQWQTLHARDCGFAYRDSLFKRQAGDYLISEVTLEVGSHLPLSIDYASLRTAIGAQRVDTLDARTISRTVCQIRSDKLPDPAVIPNVGSFFKNPVVSRQQGKQLQAQHPGLISFEQTDGSLKLAAGWLIDSLGFKGARRGGVGVHDRQALVLVHHGDADGAALMALAEEIREAVYQHYAISLVPEPVVL